MLQDSWAPGTLRSQAASNIVVLLEPVLVLVLVLVLVAGLVKKTREALRKPSMRLRQSCWVSPVVWIELVCGDGVRDWGAVYLTPHYGGAVEENACVVCPASGLSAVVVAECHEWTDVPDGVIQLRTTDQSICAIKNLKRVTDQANLFTPSVHLVGPIEVCLIVRESAEACGDVEEASLRDRVFVCIAAIEGEDLPA
jgi:hypothetical protein